MPRRGPNRAAAPGATDTEPPTAVTATDRSRVALGAWGERRAADHYRRAGFEIVVRNWRCPLGELDLVARRGRLVVVCEVKTRRTGGFGGPAAAVDHRKQARIRRLAARWLAETGVSGVDVRFDVAAVTGTRVEVIEQAF